MQRASFEEMMAKGAIIQDDPTEKIICYQGCYYFWQFNNNWTLIRVTASLSE